MNVKVSKCIMDKKMKTWFNESSNQNIDIYIAFKFAVHVTTAVIILEVEEKIT